MDLYQRLGSVTTTFVKSLGRLGSGFFYLDKKLKVYLFWKCIIIHPFPF